MGRGRRKQTRDKRTAQASRSSAAQPSDGTRATPRLLVAAALIAATVVAYLPAIDGEFVWDDDDYVSNNVTLRSFEGLRSIWLDPAATPQYYPLVHSSFWIEYHLWGLAPAGYHMTNILLHGAAAVLLWRILLRLSVPAAWLIAMIFAVHPVHVESVAWITERKNVLSGVFYLSAMLTYLHFALDPPDGGRRRQALRYAAACTLFLLALASKTVAASLPAALLLLIAWKRQRIQRRDVWLLLPLFAVGAAMAMVTVWLERHHVGAQGIDWQLSAVERCVIAGRALWFYAEKLVWPTGLAFSYPRWHVDATDPVQLAYPLAAVAVIVALWLARHKLGWSPLVAVLFFAGTLTPALGFFDVFPMRYSFVADHFQYLASIGLIALGVVAIVGLIEKWTPARARADLALAVILVPLLATLTWRQTHVFADHETLWRDTVEKYPTSWMGHTSLGALLGRRGAMREAERHYRLAVQLNPDFSTARLNLGGLLANEGRFEEAIPHMREHVRLEPGSLEPNISLGRALLLNGQPDEAVIWFRRAVAGWPEDARAHALLEEALRAQRARQDNVGARDREHRP
jgi:tetratricopeptide (TPR) repeat protein